MCLNTSFRHDRLGRGGCVIILSEYNNGNDNETLKLGYEGTRITQTKLARSLCKSIISGYSVMLMQYLTRKLSDGSGT